MKKITNIPFLSLLFLLGLSFASCVEDDDFDIPEITFEEPDVTVTSSIASVKQMYDEEIHTAPVLITGNNLVLEAYVVSNDKAGNFYKELVLQNSPENPEAGISILTDATDLYTFFEPGRKVYVRLDSLYIGLDGGVKKLGGLYGGQVGRLSQEEFAEHVLRSGEVAEIVPKLITLEEINDTKLNTLIQLKNMQFISNLLGESYGDSDNNFNVDRTLESCATGQTIILRNSGYANFKNQLLPEGNGSITAVLSKFNSDYQLFIRNPEDLVFDQPRCEALYEQNFEGLEITGPGVYFDLEGWTNVNLNAGETKFEAREFDNNKYAQISAFNSGENPLEAWLVSEGVDLSDVSGTISFTFMTKDGHNDGEGLKVYISTDFSGDVESATWTELNANIATGSTDGYADEFTPSGNIDISSYTGSTVYFGFEYIGGDGGITTTYQIDNIEVEAN